MAVRAHDGGDGAGGDRLRGPARGRLPDRDPADLRGDPPHAVGRRRRPVARGARLGLRPHPRRRHHHHLHDAAHRRLRGRPRAADGARAVLARGAPARHRGRARAGRLDRARQRAHHPALGGPRLQPEAKELAATMAGNAIGHLREAVAVAPDSDAMVPAGVLASRISEAASTMSQPFDVSSTRIGRAALPIPVAEAMYSAAVQGMVNSLQHAGSGVRRWVEVRGTRARRDPGAGGRRRGRVRPRDGPDRAPRACGSRSSSACRARAVTPRSSRRPGEGTTVTLRWPDDRSTGVPSFEQFANAGRGR